MRLLTALQVLQVLQGELEQIGLKLIPGITITTGFRVVLLLYSSRCLCAPTPELLHLPFDCEVATWREAGADPVLMSQIAVFGDYLETSRTSEGR